MFLPMQGVFNILVYCHPHVSSLRTNNPEYSWLKAFWETVRTGGDNDSAGQSRRTSSGNRSRRGSQIVLDRIKRNHISMMAKIRKERNPSNRYVLNNGNVADPEATTQTEEPAVENCGSQCLIPQDTDQLAGVDKSSALDDVDALNRQNSTTYAIIKD